MSRITLPDSIWLLRHGLSDMNILNKQQAGKLEGFATTDEPEVVRSIPDSLYQLSPYGREQCAKANTMLHRYHPDEFDAVIVSPYRRTKQTAGLALREYEARNISLDSRVIERDWGPYGYLTAPQRAEQYAQIISHREQAPEFTRLIGGESLADVSHRVQLFVESLDRVPGDVLVVSHAEFLNRVIKYFTGLDVRMDNCDIVQLAIASENPPWAKGYRHFRCEQAAEDCTEDTPWQPVPMFSKMTAQEVLEASSEPD